MRRVAMLLFASAMAIGCTPKRASSLEAPGFELKDLTGKSVSLKSTKGHPVLLDFWATWCGPCRISIPAVDALYKKHKDDGLIVLGLNMDDDPTPVLPFVKHFAMSYPVLLAGNSSVGSDYQMDGIPMFILIAPDGHVLDRFDGFSPEMPDLWEKELHPFLTKKS